MSTKPFTGNPARTMREWKRCPSIENPFSTSSMTSVNADRNRIYQALTVPEYIEAWLSIPGEISGSTRVFAGDNSFSVSYSSVQDGPRRVFCSYQIRRRSKLVFTWQHFASLESIAGMVKIRLLGDFGRTRVHVTHVGLTRSDQQWHEDLWSSSLRKLSKLF